jgi:hypothetical protein
MKTTESGVELDNVIIEHDRTFERWPAGKLGLWEPSKQRKQKKGKQNNSLPLSTVDAGAMV